MKAKLTRVSANGTAVVVGFDVVKENGAVVLTDLEATGTKHSIISNIKTVARAKYEEYEAISNLKVGDLIPIEKNARNS